VRDAQNRFFTPVFTGVIARGVRRCVAEAVYRIFRRVSIITSKEDVLLQKNKKIFIIRCIPRRYITVSLHYAHIYCVARRRGVLLALTRTQENFFASGNFYERGD
jgi:hypothetical protein